MSPGRSTEDLRRPEPEPRGDEFAIRGARVFDGTRTLARADVVVRGGRIAAVAASLELPAGLPIVEGAGKTLLPGLIDAHVHAWGESRRDALRFGVTTELDMFSDWRQLAAAKRQRESTAPVEQADLWSSGTAATVNGGHGTQFGLVIPTLASPADADDWVAARVGEGSDYVKIIRDDRSVYGGPPLPTLSAETAAAVIAAAHAHAKLAVMHVSSRAFARESLEAGADGLMHVFQDMPADEPFIELARARGAFVVPTLTLVAGMAGESNGVSEDARLSPWLCERQRQLLARRRTRPPQVALIDNARASVRRMHLAGMPVLAGTDAPNSSTTHGASLHEEIRQLVAAGLAPEDALAAATSAPAAAFGLDDRGRIEVGKRADFLLVEGDPTRDVDATRAIVGIWKNGHRIARSPPDAARAEPSVGAV